MLFILPVGRDKPVLACITTSEGIGLDYFSLRRFYFLPTQLLAWKIRYNRIKLKRMNNNPCFNQGSKREKNCT
jgi:hypothetical protein